MGGALILFALLVPALLWCDLRNGFVWLILGVTVGYGAIGFVDDYIKLTKGNPRGLPARYKLSGQFAIGAAAVGALFFTDLVEPSLRTRLALPFVDFNRHVVALPIALYLVFAVLVIVGTSNAVNLTDGLDGLAIGPVIIASGTFLILSYGAGTVLRGFNVADYLKIPYLRGTGELAIVCGAMAGAGVGFLWYNTFPASVFMGDVGALALGGALGTVAVATKNELTLLIIGGIFVLEAVSVMAQVASFKLTGRRIFRMAPIHHHFELKGWPEPKVVVRFWIISFVLALAGLATLKVR
jgi:phospho-N-acetylmuramoyl-pentapeptide-transferase